jgi:hypothetical protein
MAMLTEQATAMTEMLDIAMKEALAPVDAK